MALETEKFIVSDVEHLYAHSKEIRPDRMRRAPQAVGFAALTAACKSCGRTTRVSANGQGLAPVVGGVIVSCPFCGNEEHLTGKRLNAIA